MSLAFSDSSLFHGVIFCAPSIYRAYIYKQPKHWTHSVSQSEFKQALPTVYAEHKRAHANGVRAIPNKLHDSHSSTMYFNEESEMGDKERK